MSDRQSTYYRDKEISFKDLFLKIIALFREIIKNWKLIFYITFSIVAIRLLITFFAPITYKATLTFMVNEDEGGSSGISSILGQFGLGGGGSGRLNLNKVLELSKSRKITHSALFEKAEIDGKEDYLANHIISIYNFHEKWGKRNPNLKNFVFSHGNINVFKKQERIALESIFREVVTTKIKKGITNSDYNRDSEIMQITANSTKEDLSIALTRAIYKVLSNLYINKTIEKEERTYDLITQKADSLQIALNKANIALLRFDDRNRNIGLRQNEARKIELQQEIQKLALAYSTVFENQQIAQFNLENKTPIFQPIDIPVGPIQEIKGSLLKDLVIGVVLGGFLAVIFVIIKKMYRDIMKEEKLVT